MKSDQLEREDGRRHLRYSLPPPESLTRALPLDHVTGQPAVSPCGGADGFITHRLKISSLTYSLVSYSCLVEITSPNK